jgi:hypothetical protein
MFPSLSGSGDTFSPESRADIGGTVAEAGDGCLTPVSSTPTTTSTTSTTTTSSTTTTTLPPGGDVTPPVISRVRGSVSYNTVTILWDTNEPATSEAVSWRVETAQRRTINTQLVRQHRLLIRALSPETQYFVYVRSKDARGNTATSKRYRFTTKPRP